MEEEPKVWARWATNDQLSWESLSPGTYGIYAKYPDPRYFMQTVPKLATVTLAPGADVSTRVSLPPQRKPAPSVALFVRGLSRTELGDELETFGCDAGGRPHPAERFVEDVIGGSVLYMKAEGLRAPFYAATGDRFFSTVPDLPETPRDDVPLTAAVHARADAYAQLRFAEENLDPPVAGIAVLRDCEKAPRVTVPVEIRRDHLARFTAAAGCRSIVLALDPYEPIVTDKVLLNGDQSLGEFLLRGASSADVRVVLGPNGSIVTGATVQAISAEQASPMSIVAEATTDDRGWARLSGLPSYWNLRLIARTAQGDSSDPAEVRVRPRERALVDPLTIREPASLVVTTKLDPEFLARFPSARVVSVLVRPADPDRQSERQEANAVQAGETPIRFDRLHPGRWLATAVSRVAGTYGITEIADVTIETGETRQVEATITPNVFEGIITSDGKGVAAKVTLDDRGQKISFVSDATGAFDVVLQHKGMYRVVAARLSAQGNFIPIGNVAFTDPSRRIEITLPTGGTVMTRVRVGDRPVANTVVWISRRDETGAVDAMTNRGRTTDASGVATFEEVAPGTWTFSVRDSGTRRGASKTVVVDAGKRTTIDLDLARAAAIEGTVQDLGGFPLPRARIECLVIGPAGLPDRVTADSDTSGVFAIDLIPPQPPSALCSVISPMGSVDALRLTPGQPATIVVSGATGTLTVADWMECRNPDRVWLVAPDGRTINLQSVAAKTGRFGAQLTIPALAAGRWRAVLVESLPQLIALARGLGTSIPAITEITLSGTTAQTIRLNESSGSP